MITQMAKVALSGDSHCHAVSSRCALACVVHRSCCDQRWLTAAGSANASVQKAAMISTVLRF